MKNSATVVWKGTGKEGSGRISTKSEVLKEVQYSYKKRFEGEGPGTNPEELIAAAHASCFTMKTAFLCDAAGFPADTLDTSCVNEFKDGSVISSTLHIKGKIDRITAEKFNEIVQDAAKNCPISKLLNTEIKATGELL